MALATALSTDSRAYTPNGARWTGTPVPYVVNTANLDLPASVIVPAVQAGADTWAVQSNAAFAFTYAGTSSQTTNTYDGVNLVMFRNASSESAIATTYWWSSGSTLIEADIVFWDGAFKFFTGTSGCSGGFYIEDIAAHEFGHALGLGHSTISSATMYPSTSYCNTANRSLDPDDLAGILAVYGARPNNAPKVPTGFRLMR